MKPVSVVVTTYNRPDALAAVLEGFMAQREQGFELIVADDGSGPETDALVRSYSRRAPFALQHVWHEDQGFRAGAIRNRAVAMARSEYIIFVDGDCIPRRDFVGAHGRLCAHGRFLFGHRVLLQPAFTQRVLMERLPVHGWPLRAWLRHWARGDVNRITPLLSWPQGMSWRHRSWRGIKTCNLSAWRADLLRVNGFDEAYAGWGFEDSDLAVRLLHAGLVCHDARGVPPVLHLWHPDNTRGQTADNERRFRQRLGTKLIRAERGVDQYL